MGEGERGDIHESTAVCCDEILELEVRYPRTCGAVYIDHTTR